MPKPSKMDLLTQAAAAGTEIPLHCNICPKKPDFSDVSHLLTHIASKGHLSNYYKMKVQGGTDPDAQQAVDDYDTWYNMWSLQDLMGQRMKQKETKKGGGRGTPAPRSRNSAASSTSTRANSIASTTHPATARRGSRLRENVLNPQLDRQIKIEPPSRSGTPISSRSYDASAMHGAYGPSMHPWMGSAYSAESPMDEASAYSSDSNYFDVKPSIRGPTRPRRYNNSVHSPPNEYDAVEEMETISDAARLKGVYWEGMACFDSATPDMKRKRNQKKDYSVVQQLEATSIIIEPMEMVFDTSGALRKERTITGNPDDDDDDSHLSGESEPEADFDKPPPKKKTIRRPKPALTEKNPNTSRASRARKAPGIHQSFGNAKASTPFGDDDDDLTYEDVKPRIRNGLSIHRDNTGPDITFDHPPAGYSNYTPVTSQAAQYRSPSFHTNASAPHNLHSSLQSFTNPSNYTYSHGHGHGHGTGHQRVPSYGHGSSFGAGTFRPSSLHNYASFGHLNSQTLWHSTVLQSQHQQSPFFAQHMGFGGNGSNDFNMFHQMQNQSQPASWETLFPGSGLTDLAQHNTPTPAADNGSTGSMAPAIDVSHINALFMSNHDASPDDDQVTVSPPASEHRDR